MQASFYQLTKKVICPCTCYLWENVQHCTLLLTYVCKCLRLYAQARNTQGQTIECLEQKVDGLTAGCKEQILRVAELQSDDFHLNRPLYYACRDDREKYVLTP